MKKLLLVLPILLVGCGSQPTASATPAVGAKNALTNKLASMPASERAAYVQAHPDEVMASAGVKNVSKPK